MSAVEMEIHDALKRIMSENHGRLLSVLIANLRDFQMAEDCLQDALTSALVHWERTGLPVNPTGWLLQTARRKAIDKIRRKKNFNRKSKEYGHLLLLDQNDAAAEGAHEMPDERLRLIFTCCHPALDQKTRVALTLRTLGGLTTREIAYAFLDTESAMAQRLVRARHKIKKSGIPFENPKGDKWPERLQSVLTVVYLIFNEGYVATESNENRKVNLCKEAIFLARMLNHVSPETAEIEGFLALLLLIDARKSARVSESNIPVALEDQDRTTWDPIALQEGLSLVKTALARSKIGPYQVQAAIQAVHSEAASFEETRWDEILGLFGVLERFDNSAVIQLNKAVALSYVHGPETALDQLEDLGETLKEYYLFYCAKADFLRRLGAFEKADLMYEQALQFCANQSVAGFIKAKRRATKKEAEQLLGLSPTGR